jgi:hypothetical protein
MEAFAQQLICSREIAVLQRWKDHGIGDIPSANLEGGIKDILGRLVHSRMNDSEEPVDGQPEVKNKKYLSNSEIIGNCFLFVRFFFGMNGSIERLTRILALRRTWLVSHHGVPPLLTLPPRNNGTYTHHNAMFTWPVSEGTGRSLPACDRSLWGC